ATIFGVARTVLTREPALGRGMTAEPTRARPPLHILGAVTVEMRDVAEGLWLWRQPHPDWEEGQDWEPEVASFAVESRGTTLLLDPLAPAPAAREGWERIDRHRHEGAGVREA